MDTLYIGEAFRKKDAYLGKLFLKKCCSVMEIFRRGAEGLGRSIRLREFFCPKCYGIFGEKARGGDTNSIRFGEVFEQIWDL